MNILKAIRIAKMLDERLSPMTYKKLNELGVSKEQRKNWTQKQANEFIANRTKENPEKSEKKSNSTPNSNYSRLTKINQQDIKLNKDNIEFVPNAIGSSAQLNNKIEYKNEKFDKDAQETYDNIRKNEPEITNNMLDIANNINCKLAMLEFNTKTGSSVADKIIRKRDANKKRNIHLSDKDIINSMTDIVRYSVMANTYNETADVANKTIENLKKKGYKVIEVDNKFLNNDPSYNAIHIEAKNKKGVKFEVQIHSKESLEIKEKNHPYYTDWRNPNTSEKEQNKLFNIMKNNWSHLKPPKNINSIKSFKLKED